MTLAHGRGLPEDAHVAGLVLDGLADLEARMDLGESILPDGLAFRAWCEQLGEQGLLVDGKPFRLDNRPAMHFLYDLIPSTKEAAWRVTIAVMKASQTGVTVWEILAIIYMVLKMYPLRVGLYVPDRQLAAYVSTHRFMPILRRIPAAYDLLVEESGHSRGIAAEGNVMVRSIGASKVHFLWTSGAVATESYPLDVLTFDEVQEMDVGDVEKTDERLSASDVKLRLLLSTPKYPDSDIHWFYRRGTQYRFHTACGCPEGVILDAEGIFPNCIVFNEGQYPGAPENEYVYRCPKCDTYIPDTQAAAAVGDRGWVAENPGHTDISVHFPQTLSPTISPGEMYLAFAGAKDMENFYRRKLGRPFVDPSRIPVTLEILQACAAEGARLGLQWKASAQDTFMGIDQMGGYNVVTIKERLPDGRQAYVHAECIYDDNPFARCDDLMAQYGVIVCVVETLPNYNDAKRFAQRHKGRVFLAHYQNIEGEMMLWGDANEGKAKRKTADAERDRYTVALDQYKCMQVALTRFAETKCLFPDPKGLVQDILENNVRKRCAIVPDMMWLHFTRTALVTEETNDEERKLRRRVIKVGLDPHFSFANMLCDAAWARAYGTSSFIMPPAPGTDTPPNDTLEALKQAPAPKPLPVQIDDPLPPGHVCGRCTAFQAEGNRCTARQFIVRAQDPACPIFVERDEPA
jgi:hypothetical protein